MRGAVSSGQRSFDRLVCLVLMHPTRNSIRVDSVWTRPLPEWAGVGFSPPGQHWQQYRRTVKNEVEAEEAGGQNEDPD